MKKNLPKVSIIIATYNSGPYIQETLNSIYKQTGLGEQFNIELIVVDDCSTDDTQQILKSNDLIFFATNENSGGPNRGRNIGLKEATGQHICIVDHDDQWLQGKLLAQLEVCHLALIISSGFSVVNKTTGDSLNHQNKTKDPYIVYDRGVTFFNKMLKQKKGQNTYLGSIMFSSELKHILFEEHFGMVDFDWLLRMFDGQKLVEVNQCLYNRIVFGSNLSLNEAYRIKDFYYTLLTLEDYWDRYPQHCLLSYKRSHGSLARYYYLMGNMKRARFYFLKSELTAKTILYYITTFAGHSYVKKKFNVFG
jgi:glycosyltransferase involved in cell wall biosynthesis